MADNTAREEVEFALTAPPEVDRCNIEPAILLGLSSTEAVWAIGAAFAIWIPVGGILAFLFSFPPLFFVVAGAGPITTVWLGAKQMAAIKRNRPDMYYVHACRKWMARIGFRRSRYITHRGEWDLGRSFPAAPPQSLLKMLFKFPTSRSE